MIIKNRTKVVDYKVYEANDGTEFSTENQCLDYERNKDKMLVFVLIEKQHGRHGETVIGVFSTELKAKQWMNKWVESHDNRFYIRPEYIDGKDS